VTRQRTLVPEPGVCVWPQAYQFPFSEGL
jgi:hypothetical protein